MEEIESIQQKMNGDSAAIEKLMDIHAGNIARFAFQYGCTLTQAGEVAEATFRTLYTNHEKLNDDESLVIILYKIALNELTSIHQLDLLQEPIFQFEEDQELHEKIIRLEPNTKAPFILSQFHGMNDSAIATITEVSEEAVCTSITQAYQGLSKYVDGSHMEKRLKFLHKSYGRISSSFRKEQVFEEPKKVEQITSETRQRVSKKAIISWIAGILVLFGLVAVPVVTGEEYQRASAERYVEKLKQSFEEEMTSRFTTLGFTEPTEKDRDKFYMITYGRQAREEFETMTRRLERSIADNGTVDKKELGEQYDEIIKKLELPSEKAERLFNNPLTNDKEKSEEFIRDYMMQFFEVLQDYYAITYKHEQLIQESIVNGMVDIDKFLKKKETYPEDLQLALDGMASQNIFLQAIPEWVRIVPNFGKTEFSAKIRASIHEDFGGYLTTLEYGQSIYNLNNTKLVDELIDALIDIEKTIFASSEEESKDHYFMLNHYYSALFNAIIVGNEPNQFLHGDGKVVEDVRNGWKRIASLGEDSPSAIIAKIIVDEMEASGWTESESRNRLNEKHIQNAIELAKEGKLDSFKMSGIIKGVNGLDFVSFPDTTFEYEVEETYNQFASRHDLSLLKNLHPLIIIGVYFYANNQEDPETMWHLYSHTHNVETLEEYMSKWTKTDFNLYKIVSLHFDSFGKLSGSTGSIGFQTKNSFSNSVHMTLDEDSLWKIKHIFIDSTLLE